ncbi:MAG TPA: TolC family protein, partial [Candidatus Kryptonia bacterium]|nr:TolC family protein [Candidatus Kryptonia bacterium]
MRRAQILLTLVVITAALNRARGADVTLSEPLTLDVLVAYARAHNPEIRAAEARWRAALARPAQAGALPDPMLN